MTIEIGEDTDYEPDAVVSCGERLDDEAIAVPDQVIIVEVESPSTRSTDAGGKLADYFRLDSVQHYLIVRTSRRQVIHHRRDGGRIETRIVLSRRGFTCLPTSGLSRRRHGARPCKVKPALGGGSSPHRDHAAGSRSSRIRPVCRSAACQRSPAATGEPARQALTV